MYEFTEQQLDKYFTWLALGGRKPATVQNHRNCIASLLKRGVNPHDYLSIETYLNHVKLTLSSSYYNNYVNCLRVYAQYCKEHNIKYVRKLTELKFVKDKYRPRATMNVEEIEAFLSLEAPTSTHSGFNGSIATHKVNKNKHLYWSMFFNIMAYTGMRTGEVAKLKVENVDFGRNIFVLEDTKTNENRLVPIPKNILVMLEGYVKHIGKGYLFYSKRPVGYTSNVEWHYNFHARIKRLGIVRPNLTPYSLRHSYITEMLQTEGVNIFDVKNLVGHHDTRTTENYYHLTTKRLQRVSEKHPGVVKNDPVSILIQINELLDKLELHRDNRFKVVKEFGGNCLKYAVELINN